MSHARRRFGHEQDFFNFWAREDIILHIHLLLKFKKVLDCNSLNEVDLLNYEGDCEMRNEHYIVILYFHNGKRYILVNIYERAYPERKTKKNAASPPKIARFFCPEVQEFAPNPYP